MIDHAKVIDDINELLDSSERDRDQMERTLTDGYAHALSLEAERWRVQKKLRALAATIERGDLARKSKEMAELAHRIEQKDGELTGLRELLTRLRNQYSETLAKSR